MIDWLSRNLLYMCGKAKELQFSMIGRKLNTPMALHGRGWWLRRTRRAII